MAFSKEDIIPVHKLRDRTEIGIHIMRIDNISTTNIEMDIHRDDHYIFVLQEKGESELIVDFKVVLLKGCATFYILPGQVHHGTELKDTSGWFVAIDTSLVIPEFRSVFEENLEHIPLNLTVEVGNVLGNCLSLLHGQLTNFIPSGIGKQVVQSLATSCIGIIAESYQSVEAYGHVQVTRPVSITRQFKALLFKNFKHMKRPSQFAEALHISTSYLNEAVKATTGFPVIYWIHQEIILEAKRLLYYSDHTVKEIAFSLGFEDEKYFSRLFSKIANTSPRQFRKLYRD